MVSVGRLAAGQCSPGGSGQTVIWTLSVWDQMIYRLCVCPKNYSLIASFLPEPREPRLMNKVLIYQSIRREIQWSLLKREDNGQRKDLDSFSKFRFQNDGAASLWTLLVWEARCERSPVSVIQKMFSSAHVLFEQKDERQRRREEKLGKHLLSWPCVTCCKKKHAS